MTHCFKLFFFARPIRRRVFEQQAIYRKRGLYRGVRNVGDFPSVRRNVRDDRIARFALKTGRSFQTSPPPSFSTAGDEDGRGRRRRRRRRGRVRGSRGASESYVVIDLRVEANKTRADGYENVHASPSSTHHYIRVPRDTRSVFVRF